MQIPKFSLWIGTLALCGGMTLHADDTPAQAAARAALMQQLQSDQSNSAPATAAAPVTAMPVDPLTGDNAAQAAARAAVIKKMTDLGTPMNQTGTVASQPIPMAAPAAPVSMSKEEKLQILLDHYKADQVSPEQYHEQRAAILAAP